MPRFFLTYFQYSAICTHEFRSNQCPRKGILVDWVASLIPGNLLEMQILGFNPNTSSPLGLNKSSVWLIWIWEPLGWIKYGITKQSDAMMLMKNFGKYVHNIVSATTYNWPLNNSGGWGTHPLHSWNRNITSSIQVSSSTDSSYCCTYYWRKSTYMWTCKVQTRVVQGSTVPYKPSYGNLVCMCIFIFIYIHTQTQICKVENDKHQKVSNIYLWKRSSPNFYLSLFF